MIHELKTWPEYFQAIHCGDKPFEVRKNDRDYKEGDTLILREWDMPANHFDDGYTGRIHKVEVTYILNHTDFVKEGYVILGVKELIAK